MNAFRLKQGQGVETSATHRYPYSPLRVSRKLWIVGGWDPHLHVNRPYILNITSYPFLKDYYYGVNTSL